jgi:type VI protein secretion system component Hcp
MQAVKGVTVIFFRYANVTFDYRYHKESGYDHWDALYLALINQ